MKENSMNKEETEKLKDLKAVYSGAIQSGEIGIANMIKGGIDLIEKLQKENEELKIKNNAIKRESEAYAEKMIRLDIEKQDYFEKYRYHLQQNESLTKEFSNVIPVQKVKDKIKEIGEKIKYEENEKVVIYLHKQKNILQELLKESEK